MKSETAQGYERGIMLLPGAMSFRKLEEIPTFG